MERVATYSGAWWAEDSALTPSFPTDIIGMVEEYRWSPAPRRSTNEVDDIWAVMVWPRGQFIVNAERILKSLAKWVDGLVLMDCVERWGGDDDDNGDARHQLALAAFRSKCKLVHIKRRFIDVSTHTNEAFQVIGTRCRFTTTFFSNECLDLQIDKATLLRKLDDWLQPPPTSLWWPNGRPFLWACPPVTGMRVKLLQSVGRARGVVRAQIPDIPVVLHEVVFMQLCMTEELARDTCSNLLLDLKSPDSTVSDRAEFYLLYDFLNERCRLLDLADEQKWRRKAIAFMKSDRGHNQERYMVAFKFIQFYWPSAPITELFSALADANFTCCHRRRVDVLYLQVIEERLKRGEFLEDHVFSLVPWLFFRQHITSNALHVESGLFAIAEPLPAAIPFALLIRCFLYCAKHRHESSLRSARPLLQSAHTLAVGLQREIFTNQMHLLDTSLLITEFISSFTDLSASTSLLCAQYARVPHFAFVDGNYIL